MVNGGVSGLSVDEESKIALSSKLRTKTSKSKSRVVSKSRSKASAINSKPSKAVTSKDVSEQMRSGSVMSPTGESNIVMSARASSKHNAALVARIEKLEQQHTGQMEELQQ